MPSWIFTLDRLITSLWNLDFVFSLPFFIIIYQCIYLLVYFRMYGWNFFFNTYIHMSEISEKLRNYFQSMNVWVLVMQPQYIPRFMHIFRTLLLSVLLLLLLLSLLLMVDFPTPYNMLNPHWRWGMHKYLHVHGIVASNYSSMHDRGWRVSNYIPHK